MNTRESGRDTPLDRVAGALSSESARTELYRYATSVAEEMPPDASSWYVVGAVMQVNAVTRRELASLASEAKKGGTILAGLASLTAWFPRASAIATAAAAAAVFVTLVVLVVSWRFAYGVGWHDQENVRWKTWSQSACESLASVRHDLRSHGNDVRALDHERVRRGCRVPAP